MSSQTVPGSEIELAPVPASVDAGELASHLPLIKDSLGYLVGKVIPGFFGLISVPIFVRLIGVEEYGRLAVVLPIVMALGGAGSGWLQQGILRFHPPSETFGAGTTFDRAVTRGTILAVTVLGLALTPLLWVLHYKATVWIIVEAYCAFQLIYMISLTRLQARLKPRAFIRNEALRSIGGFVIPVCLILALREKSFSLIILGLALGYLVPLLFNAGLPKLLNGFRSRENEDRDFETKHILRQLWRFGWAVGVWLMLCQALPVVGRSAIQKYDGYAQAGIYASLYELAVRSFSLFAAPVLQAAHPRIMRHWNAGQFHAARNIIRHSIRIQVLMFLPIEALGVIFAAPITRLILGPGNTASNSLLPLLMLGGFLWQVALLVHKPLEIMQRTATMLYGMLGVLLIECAGNYLLVPRFGMQSAVYVFVFGVIAYIAFAASFRDIFLTRTSETLSVGPC